MKLIVILVLGLAGFTTQDSKESLRTRNLKKLDHFPAIQSFLKQLYAHDIQGLPHASGSDRSDHHHDHWHGSQAGNQHQKEKTSSYTNIQNVNLIVKGNRAANPFHNLEHLKPLFKDMKSVKEIHSTIPRCGDGRCDDEYDDRKNKHQNRVEESLYKILNNIKQGVVNNVKPVLPYWGEMSGISVNNNSYNYQQDYELRCGCNRVPQREGTNGNGQYDLRCGCSKMPLIYRSEKLEEGENYDLRCGCDRVSEREGNNGNGKYNLRCGCRKKHKQGYIYQRERPEGYEQYNLRCGCDRVYQREDNGQYDLRCGCNDEDLESNGQYELRCGCGRISQGMDDYGRYNLRCGCNKGYQREDIEISSQYDLRCGCSKASQREGVDSNGQYNLRCGCSRSSTESVMDDINEPYYLRCGCNRSPYREGNSNGQLDLRCDCTDRLGKSYGDLVEMQGPRYDDKNVISIRLDDGDENQDSVTKTNIKTRLVNEVNEVPPVSYPDSIYMGLDPNDKYFTKINKDMKTKVSPQEMVTFYNAWKEQMIDNLVSYVIGDSDSIDQSHMTPIQRRIVRNLRSTLSKLKHLDGRKLRNRLSSLLFGVESQSRVLPHDDPSPNVYVPRWVYSLLQKHASDRKQGIRKGHLSWFPMSKKQKLRLQTIIQKQRASNNAESRNLRRSQSSDAGYGVPFEMDIQGLAQVNP